MERRYHNPYRHWFSGLGTEIITFVLVLSVLAAVTLASAALVR